MSGEYGRAGLKGYDGSLIYRLDSRSDADLDHLPMTVKVLLEGLLRAQAAGRVEEEDVAALATWPREPKGDPELPFTPARVLLQDFTGVPAVVDLAAMRSAMERAGKDAGKVDPLVPADLVIDHSVQVDAFGSLRAYDSNIVREYERNHERYSLLRWAQQAFHSFSVVPPGMGICHQVNLEYLARVVQEREEDGRRLFIPDTLVGTDSHTTMVNGLGVLGWGVGGIEAEAALLGQAMYLPRPVVVGVKFHGELRPGATATDLVLTVTEMLRKHGVVDKFVEYCGPGLSSLSVPDRATLSNMSPEMGCTSSLFPVDAQTLRYLELTGRPRELIDLVEAYCKEQGLFRTDQSPTPSFSEMLELDLDTVEPSLAGPRRPQDRQPLPRVWQSFCDAFGTPPDNGQTSEGFHRMGSEGADNEASLKEAETAGAATAVADRPAVKLADGAVVIAAITSCTNTSNPSVMVAAGLLAKAAVERGLQVQAHVKTSLAPGSRVVTDYLKHAGLMEYLEKLGFYLVGYGCTTCIGNSGPLATPEIEKEVTERELSVAAVLSGNRNFEARIHPLVKASYLGSPPLVVAYALAGTLRRDLTKEPLGMDRDGKPVMLSEIWPSPELVARTVGEAVEQQMYTREYQRIFEGDDNWKKMDSPTGAAFDWDPDSTYVQEPPYFDGFKAEPEPLTDLEGARCLVMVADSVTTDHISPAGSIATDSPAGRYLVEHGVEKIDFNSYGARRGNHQVMVRGTFGNIRLRNELASREGYWTTHQPSGDEMTIYDASVRYQEEGVPLVVLAGKEYGSGSSRDWAAKGPLLLGIRAVIAESFERIHRANLVGMGVLPLQFKEGDTRQSLGLTGRERYSLKGFGELKPRQKLTVEVESEDGGRKSFEVTARLNNETDVEYLRHGGVLPMVLRQLIGRG